MGNLFVWQKRIQNFFLSLKLRMILYELKNCIRTSLLYMEQAISHPSNIIIYAIAGTSPMFRHEIKTPLVKIQSKIIIKFYSPAISSKQV